MACSRTRSANFDDVAGFGFQLLLEKIRQPHFSDEAKPLAVLLIGRGQVNFLCQPPHLWFGQFPNGKMRLLELGLGQLAQKIALVFVGVNARQQAVGHLSIHLERFLAAVMAGRYAFCPQFKGRLEEQVKFDFAVAQHIWVGVRPAAYSSNM